jgi:hypothetical protein
LHERNQAKWALDGFPAKLEKNISSIADWNRSRNEVTLVAIPSARSDGFLKGLVLAAYEGCVSYRKFVPAMRYGRPYRDFMYNVTYESIAFAYHAWGARKIGVTHLSCAASGYRRDITTCQIEAMIHFCNEHDEVESFTFVDERDGNKPLEILTEFQQLEDAGSHRNITRTIQEHWGTTFVDLDWTKV